LGYLTEEHRSEAAFVADFCAAIQIAEHDGKPSVRGRVHDSVRRALTRCSRQPQIDGCFDQPRCCNCTSRDTAFPVISRRQVGALSKVVEVVFEYQRSVLLALARRDENLGGFEHAQRLGGRRSGAVEQLHDAVDREDWMLR
jgi:hypothetical protein